MIVEVTISMTTMTEKVTTSMLSQAHYNEQIKTKFWRKMSEETHNQNTDSNRFNDHKEKNAGIYP